MEIKLKESKLESDCTSPAVNLNSIYRARINSSMVTGRYPTYVMLHPINKRAIFEEAENTNLFEFMCPLIQTIFGMKAIWTTDVGENEITCTYRSNELSF